MSYTINSEIFVLGKKGAVISEKELSSAGCNIAALIAGGHLVSTNATPSPATEGENK